MAAKSILLKVSPEVHAGIQEVAGRHQRSMQGVLVALIESWLQAGGPDPLQFDMQNPQAASGAAVDREARRAIEALVERVSDLQEQVLGLTASRDPGRSGWAERVVSDLGVGVERRGRSGGTPFGSAVVVTKTYDGQIPPDMRVSQAEQLASYQAGLGGLPPSTDASDESLAYLKELGTRPSTTAAPLDVHS